MKLGRRAPSAGAYASLRASIEATLGLEVNLVEPHKLSVRQQLEEMSRAAVAVSPDGGASFACAFLADGAAVVILGYLERWIWANDRRVRAFYCAPRDDHLPCEPAIGSPSEGGDRSARCSPASAPSARYSVRSLRGGAVVVRVNLSNTAVKEFRHHAFAERSRMHTSCEKPCSRTGPSGRSSAPETSSSTERGCS